MNCPVCGNEHYKYNRYYDEYWGGIYVCEEHGYCERCGYVVDQAYSKPFDGFEPDTTRGYKDRDGDYHPKNTRKRARIRKKYNIKRHRMIWW